MSQQQAAHPAPEVKMPAKQAEAVVPGYAWVILLVVFLASVAAPLNQFKVPPLMPVLMQAFALDIGNAGWLMSIFAVTGFLLALPAGFIIQGIGPKVTGLIAVGCLTIGSAIGALATSAGLLLTSRVIEGIGMGLIAVVAPAAIAMWFPREKQGMPMGLWATWVPVGSVIMYNLAPALGGAGGWQTVWWFGAGFALLALVLFWLLFRMPPAMEGAHGGGPQGEAPPNLGRALSNRDIWLLALEFGLFNLVFLAFSTFLPTFLSEVRGYTLAGASFTSSLVMIVAIFSAPLAGLLSDRIGSRKLVFTIPFVLLSFMMLLPFNVTGWMIPAFMIVLGIIAGATPTATFAAAPEVMGKPQLAGIGMAVVSLGQNLGMFIGPALFGGMVASMGWTTAGYLLIPFLVVALFASWLVRVR